MNKIWLAAEFGADGRRWNSGRTGKFSGDGIDEACATGERGWKTIGRKDRRRAAGGHDRGENGRARASCGVSASVCVCAGVGKYEITC